MKQIVVNILLVFLCTHFESNAQQLLQKSPNLFDKYPAEIHISTTQISNLLRSNEKDSVALQAADGTMLKGHVGMSKNFDEVAQTVSLELKDFPAGTRLVINRINKDGKIIYRAHILNHKNPDAYILKSYDDKEFIFVKTAREKIVTD